MVKVTIFVFFSPESSLAVREPQAVTGQNFKAVTKNMTLKLNVKLGGVPNSPKGCWNDCNNWRLLGQFSSSYLCRNDSEALEETVVLFHNKSGLKIMLAYRL